jgi:hypothetical protein
MRRCGLLKLLPLLLLISCSRGGGNQQPSPGPGWSNFGGGETRQLANPFFLNPLIAYVIRQPNNLAVGRTITLDYTVNGSGNIQTPNDNPPAQFRLFLWQSGDNFSGQGDLANFRAWCPGVTGQLTEGNHIITCPVNGSWTGVFGAPLGNRINQLVANISSVGFTCGGRDFAGKGCQANNISVRINRWQIQ